MVSRFFKTGRKAPCPAAYMAGAKANHDKASEELAPVIAIAQEYRKYCTFKRIAEKLNQQGIKTRWGNPWSASNVHQILKRVDQM
jgi:hypothetical protein